MMTRLVGAIRALLIRDPTWPIILPVLQGDEVQTGNPPLGGRV